MYPRSVFSGFDEHMSLAQAREGIANKVRACNYAYACICM